MINAFDKPSILKRRGMTDKILDYFKQVGLEVKRAEFIFDGFAKTVDKFHQ
jgi:hypothetical protein